MKWEKEYKGSTNEIMLAEQAQRALTKKTAKMTPMSAPLSIDNWDK